MSVGGALTLLLLLMPAVGLAQEDAPPPTVTGSIAIGAWSSSRNLEDETGFGVGRFTGKLVTHPAEFLRFGFEARVYNQDVTREGEEDTRGELREAWLDVALGDDSEVRLGKQLATWGRADGINPTDLLNARDFTRLVPDESDMKLGTWVLEATRYFGDVSLAGMWIVHFEPHRLPFAGLPVGLSLGEERPDNGYRQGAVRLEIVSETIDASLSYYDGYDHTPDLRFDGSTATLVYPRIRVIGADAAKNFGRFGVRVEVSYTFQDPGFKSAPLPERRDVVYLVAGFDRSFFEYTSVNVQYIGRYSSGFTPHDAIADENVRDLALTRSLLIQQHRRTQHGMSLRVANKWLHETLELGLEGLIWFAPGDFVLSPKLVYAASDRLTLAAGAEYYHGPSASAFGFLEKNRTAFVELEWGF